MSYEKQHRGHLHRWDSDNHCQCVLFRVGGSLCAEILVVMTTPQMKTIDLGEHAFCGGKARFVMVGNEGMRQCVKCGALGAQCVLATETSDIDVTLEGEWT